MDDASLEIKVRLSAAETLVFRGACLGRVVALDHDHSVRRQFSVYSYETGYVVECVDQPGSLMAQTRAARCRSVADIYDFFGNEPLANYLYGLLRLSVSGLRIVEL